MSQSELRSTPSADAPVPKELEIALSPSWLESTLVDRWPGHHITAVNVTESLKTMATKVRFDVTYETASHDAPKSFCVKGFFDCDEYSGRAAPVSLVESYFYHTVAPALTVTVPDCLYAGSDASAQRGVILMRDLCSQGGKFLTALADFGVERARLSLDQLARLHAYRGPGFDEQGGLIVSKLDGFARSPVLPEELLQQLLDGPRGDTLAPELRSAARLNRGIAALAGAQRTGPSVLIHGDAHAGNIFERQGQIGLIDWQMLQKGNWALDVAYHIAAVLTRAEAEASEWMLLRHYLERVAFHGGEPVAFEVAEQAYRQAMVYGYYLWAITRRVDPAIVNVFVERLGSAVHRHGSFALLGV